MAYQPGCRACEVGQAYWDNIRKRTEETGNSLGSREKPVLVSVTISATDVPFCEQHNDDEPST